MLLLYQLFEFNILQKALVVTYVRKFELGGSMTKPCMLGMTDFLFSEIQNLLQIISNN